MYLNCGAGEDSWESLGLKGDPTKENQSWIFIGRTDAPILWPTDAKDRLIWKDPDAGKDWRWEEKGMTEEEIVGWHHLLNGHGFEQAPGVGGGQGSLARCSPCDHRIKHDWVTELNWPQQNKSILKKNKNKNKKTTTPNIILNGEKMKAFPLRKKTRMCTLATVVCPYDIQHRNTQKIRSKHIIVSR